MMKIILNEKALRVLMAQHDIRTYKQLCKECGIDYNFFCMSRSRNKSFSKEIFWLLADVLKCHIEDLQQPDWHDN